MSNIKESNCRSRKGQFWYHLAHLETCCLQLCLLEVKTPEGKRTMKALWVSRTWVCQVSNTIIHRLHSTMSEALLSWCPLSLRTKPRILRRHLSSFNTDLTSQPQNVALLALRNLPSAALNMLFTGILFFSPYSFWPSYPPQMHNISVWRKK